MMENEAVKSGEKMGMEGIWLREGGGGMGDPGVFSLDPPFWVILKSSHLGRKYGERGVYGKLLIYLYLLPHVVVVVFSFFLYSNLFLLNY